MQVAADQLRLLRHVVPRPLLRATRTQVRRVVVDVAVTRYCRRRHHSPSLAGVFVITRLHLLASSSSLAFTCWRRRHHSPSLAGVVVITRLHLLASSSSLAFTCWRRRHRRRDSPSSLSSSSSSSSSCRHRRCLPCSRFPTCCAVAAQVLAVRLTECRACSHVVIMPIVPTSSLPLV